MERNLHFQNFNLGKLTNGLFNGFMSSLLHRIDEVGAEPLGLETSMVDELRKNVELLNDLICVSKKNAETNALQKLEVERSNFMRFIHKTIQTHLILKSTEEHEKAQKLAIVAKDLCKESYQNGRVKKIAAIDAYLLDFDKEENVPLLKALGLDAAVESLRTANARFLELYVQRLEARKDISALPKNKKVREDTMILYEVITDHIFAHSVINKSEASRNFIVQTNMGLKEINKSYKQSISQKKRWETQ